ncbi:hypothetical protein Droror1_Dr00022475 [Drosera rotundifolia]
MMISGGQRDRCGSYTGPGGTDRRMATGRAGWGTLELRSSVAGGFDDLRNLFVSSNYSSRMGVPSFGFDWSLSWLFQCVLIELGVVQRLGLALCPEFAGSAREFGWLAEPGF